MVAWIHGSHLSDNKLLNDTLNKAKVYLGQDKDWSISDYLEKRETYHQWRGISKRDCQIVL
jgi:hypothetical protein